MDWNNILTYIVPILTGIGSYVAGRHKRKNDFLSDLQSSIDLLSERNRTLLEEVVNLRAENARLLSNQTSLQQKVEKLTAQNAAMAKEIEALTEKWGEIKSITRKK